jgi:TPP-dependent pyruvate/acetoin dehydrogenase alpha subunit
MLKPPALPKEQLVRMYRKMVRIRKFEEKVTQLFLKSLVPGTIHLCQGQEAVAAGAVECLRSTDRVILTHRPHGQALAKGMDPGRLLAEILGKATGCCRGKGGSMHIADVSNGVMPSLPIVGSGIPIAAGMAFAFKYHCSDSVTMGFFGDGTTNIGAFHEAMNLAAVWKLPVVYVCENNLYAVSTRIQDTTLVEDLSEKARIHGMPGLSIDGNDVELVHAAVSSAVEAARKGLGPSFIECKTYRHGGHSRTDPATYRSKEEVQLWLSRDPILRCRRLLTERGYLNDAECSWAEAQEEELIEEAAAFALSSPAPEGAWALDGVFK